MKSRLSYWGDRGRVNRGCNQYENTNVLINVNPLDIGETHLVILHKGIDIGFSFLSLFPSPVIGSVEH